VDSRTINPAEAGRCAYVSVRLEQSSRKRLRKTCIVFAFPHILIECTEGCDEIKLADVSYSCGPRNEKAGKSKARTVLQVVSGIRRGK
jgi:hypothetical protein